MSEPTAVTEALLAMEGVSGYADIAAERFRQVLVLGHDLESDRAYSVYDLVAPAIVLLGGEPEFVDEQAFALEPEDARSDLVRAGALIAAAIDRLDAEESEPKRPKPAHIVEVIVRALRDSDEDDPAVGLEFTCTGDRGSDCHYYAVCDPEDATCEHPPGWPHPKDEHDECWIASWFDVAEMLVYEGDDARSGTYSSGTGPCLVDELPPAVPQRGEIDVSWDGDVLRWFWVTEAQR